MRREKGTIQQEQTVGAAHSLECRIKVVRTPDRYRLKPHAERPCSDLRLPKLQLLVGRISLIQEHCDSPKLGNELREQLQALRGDFRRMCGQSGDVSIRASQARHEANLNRIVQ